MPSSGHILRATTANLCCSSCGRRDCSEVSLDKDLQHLTQPADQDEPSKQSLERLHFRLGRERADSALLDDLDYSKWCIRSSLVDSTDSNLAHACMLGFGGRQVAVARQGRMEQPRSEEEVLIRCNERRQILCRVECHVESTCKSRTLLV